MAEDLIKVKDLPIISNYEDVLPDDRVVTTHLSGSTRETVAVTIDALGRKIEADAPNSAAVPRNLFGYDDPVAVDGRNNDLYFKLMNGGTGLVVTASYVKIDGRWVSFQVTDDNWRKFMEGQGFDVVTYDATSIKAHAFDENTEINSVIAPNVEYIYEYAFHASSVKSVYLPKCKLIDKQAFQNCESYYDGTHIDLPSIETIGNNAFDGFGNATHKATINISNVQTIGSKAFYTPYFWRDANSVIDLPNCTSIGDSAFAAYGSGNSHLKAKKINLPAIVTIGSQAFRSWEGTGLELHIGPNCTSIGSNILWDRRSYQGTLDIYVYAVTPPSLDTAFDKELGVANWMPTHLYVPYQSVQAYKEDNVWGQYESVIEAIPEEE